MSKSDIELRDEFSGLIVAAMVRRGLVPQGHEIRTCIQLAERLTIELRATLPEFQARLDYAAELLCEEDDDPRSMGWVDDRGQP